MLNGALVVGNGVVVVINGVVDVGKGVLVVSNGVVDEVVLTGIIGSGGLVVIVDAANVVQLCAPDVEVDPMGHCTHSSFLCGLG